MNTNEQIAREAAEKLGPKDEKVKAVATSIILSAIEKSTEFYSLRFNALQKQQHDMREPERTMVCDILANASTPQPPVTDATALLANYYDLSEIGRRKREASQRPDATVAALAAEREKSRILGNMTDGVRKEIKEHQARRGFTENYRKSSHLR